MLNARLTLGSLEPVSLPSLGVKNVLAKVDTGAFSGALHCSGIRVEVENGKSILHFTPLGNKLLATQTDNFREIIVRSASGHESKRYIIPVEVSIKGVLYPTTIGLGDRRMMKREMLLGRRFLLEHNVLIDVNLSKDFDNEAETIEGERKPGGEPV